MRKTCRNCIYYHACIGDDTGYHIHNYCSAWNIHCAVAMDATINAFLESYFNDIPDTAGVIYDDYETGLAECYRFEPNDEAPYDAEMKACYELNKAAAIATINKILETKEYHCTITNQVIKVRDTLAEYLIDLKNKIENSNEWEEDNGKVCGK